MGLSAWAGKKVETLSKGMAQKVQFIATVVARPQLVLLDEPFSGLDPVNTDVLRQAILDLRRDGATIIFSTHDMAVAEKMCDFIFMIHQGRKVLDGTLESIQDTYGSDTIRVALDDCQGRLDDLPGVVAVTDFGRCQELRHRQRRRAPADPGLADAARPGTPFRDHAADPARHLRPHRPPGRRPRGGGCPCVRSWSSPAASSWPPSEPRRSSSACCSCLSSWAAAWSCSCLLKDVAEPQGPHLRRHRPHTRPTVRAQHPESRRRLQRDRLRSRNGQTGSCRGSLVEVEEPADAPEGVDQHARAAVGAASARANCRVSWRLAGTWSPTAPPTAELAAKGDDCACCVTRATASPSRSSASWPRRPSTASCCS